jgi:hypothetical protein
MILLSQFLFHTEKIYRLSTTDSVCGRIVSATNKFSFVVTSTFNWEHKGHTFWKQMVRGEKITAIWFVLGKLGRQKILSISIKLAPSHPSNHVLIQTLKIKSINLIYRKLITTTRSQPCDSLSSYCTASHRYTENRQMGVTENILIYHRLIKILFFIFYKLYLTVYLIQYFI